jgi:hypothetical protein
VKLKNVKKSLKLAENSIKEMKELAQPSDTTHGFSCNMYSYIPVLMCKP